MLNSKQRAFLRSVAHDEDTILTIGKGGITKEVVIQADDALEARELIKCKVLGTSDKSVKEVSNEIAESTKSEVVYVMGGKFVLYRKNEENPKIKLPRSK